MSKNWWASADSDTEDGNLTKNPVASSKATPASKNLVRRSGCVDVSTTKARRGGLISPAVGALSPTTAIGTSRSPSAAATVTLRASIPRPENRE